MYPSNLTQKKDEADGAHSANFTILTRMPRKENKKLPKQLKVCNRKKKLKKKPLIISFT